jgi:hypothetical protein
MNEQIDIAPFYPDVMNFFHTSWTADFFAVLAIGLVTLLGCQSLCLQRREEKRREEKRREAM